MTLLTFIAAFSVAMAASLIVAWREHFASRRQGANNGRGLGDKVTLIRGHRPHPSSLLVGSERLTIAPGLLAFLQPELLRRA